MRMWFRRLKPLLYLAFLYLCVSWSLRRDYGTLAIWIVAAPAAIGWYVYLKFMEAFRNYDSAAGFELYINVRYCDTPKNLHEHPYMKAAHEAVLKKRDEMKVAGQEIEFERCISSGLSRTTGIRLLYHKGLIWSEKHKTFVEKVRIDGRPYGDVLGLEESVEAQIEPSILIQEHRGVITVLLVPVEPLDAKELNLLPPRRRSVLRASRVLEGDREEEPGSPPAVKLGEFPVREFTMLLYLPDSALSFTEYSKAWDTLQEKYGLARKPRDHAPFVDDWHQLDSDYVEFHFRSL